MNDKLYQALLGKGFNKKSAEKLCMNYEKKKKPKDKATILSSQVFSGADAVVAAQKDEEDK